MEHEGVAPSLKTDLSIPLVSLARYRSSHTPVGAAADTPRARDTVKDVASLQ